MKRFISPLLAVMASVLLCGCVHPTSETRDPSHPNIVFILVDDMGWRDTGYHGAEFATPNIDALAEQGTVLDRNYAFPVCSPTRAALLTGKNPLRYGVDGAMQNDAALSHDLKLLPARLRDAGYDTEMVGKWHLGMAKVEDAPDSRGFNHFYGMLGGFSDYYRHLYFGGYDLQRDGVSDRTPGYLTDLLTDEALKVIDRASTDARPLFLYLAYNAPHTPLHYPPGMRGDYPEIKDPDRRAYADMVTYVDTAIGKVLARLRQNGMAENTIVVFMSDNGGLEGGGSSNYPLRAGKGRAFEGGIRVPAVVTWANRIGHRLIDQQPIFMQDWSPTLLEAAGVHYDPSDFEGTSKWGTILGSQTGEPDKEPVIIGATLSKAVFQWPYKLVRDSNKKTGVTEEYLFDVIADPEEKNNLIAAHPALAATLRSALDALPALPSKGNKGPPPEHLFRNPDGSTNLDYRMEETCAPWAEAARGKTDLPACKE